MTIIQYIQADMAIAVDVGVDGGGGQVHHLRGLQGVVVREGDAEPAGSNTIYT